MRKARVHPHVRRGRGAGADDPAQPGYRHGRPVVDRHRPSRQGRAALMTTAAVVREYTVMPLPPVDTPRTGSEIGIRRAAVREREDWPDD